MENKHCIDYVGKNYYEFDKEYEMIVYKYLCFKSLKKGECKIINDNHKFLTYMQWKNYIYDKYREYEDDKLNEFSHFLEQNIRNATPKFENWKLIITVLLTLFCDKIFETIIEIACIKLDSVFQVIIEIISIFLMIFIFAYVVEKLIQPLWGVPVEDNLYKDYKKIIDDIVRNRIEDKI